MRIPDRFDLCVRKILETASPERQLDLLLGSLLARSELYFWNIGSREAPLPASSPISDEQVLLVYSDPSRLLEALEYYLIDKPGGRVEGPGSISMTPIGTFEFCLKNNTGLLVNPLASEHNLLVPHEHVKAFYLNWKESAKHAQNCFWVPNMTDEEEDFWQERGL